MAKMTDDELEQATREMTKRATVSRNGITFTSGGRRYTFYFHTRAKALMVKIGGRAHKVLPGIEALAASLRTRRVCPTCFKVFPRRGKQAYCTTKCSATARQRRLRAKVAVVKQREKREAFRVQLATNDALRRKAEARRRKALSRKRARLAELEKGHAFIESDDLTRPAARRLGVFRP